MTFPYKLRSAAGKVAVYKITGVRAHYQVRWVRGFGKKKVQMRERITKAELAITRANEIFQQLKAGEEAMTQVDQAKLAYYVACENLLEGRTDLLSAVRFYMEQVGGTMRGVKTEAAVARYLESQGKQELSESHIRNITHHLAQFKKAFTGNVQSISVSNLTGYLEQIADLYSRRNHRLTLVHFFKWCKTQGLLAAHMPTAAERTTQPRIKRKNPGILSPEDFERVLRAAETRFPKLIPYLVLGGFAGIRVAEIQRLQMSDINFDQSIIHLSCEITKTNTPRTAKMPANLVTWLRKYAPESGPAVEYSAPEIARITLCKALDIKWPKNCLRHSFVSYMIQLSRNGAELAQQCGHSMHVASAYYTALTTPDEAAAWFGILPS